jgi:tetratricopeptide (TPR) repeat protein
LATGRYLVAARRSGLRIDGTAFNPFKEGIVSEGDEKIPRLVRVGTRLLRERKTAEALPLLLEAYRLDNDNLDAALNLSSAYILTGRFSRARQVLERLRERHPQNAMVWTNLGAAFLGNPVLATDEAQRRAIDAFEHALSIDPTAPSVAYNIGLIYRDRRDREKAINWFRRALRTNPADRDAERIVGRLLAEEEE